MSHFEKWVTFKTGSHLENGSLIEKWVTLKRMGQSWKNVSHPQKWVTLRKWVRLKVLNFEELSLEFVLQIFKPYFHEFSA